MAVFQFFSLYRSGSVIENVLGEVVYLEWGTGAGNWSPDKTAVQDFAKPTRTRFTIIPISYCTFQTSLILLQAVLTV